MVGCFFHRRAVRALDRPRLLFTLFTVDCSLAFDIRSFRKPTQKPNADRFALRHLTPFRQVTPRKLSLSIEISMAQQSAYLASALDRRLLSTLIAQFCILPLPGALRGAEGWETFPGWSGLQVLLSSVGLLSVADDRLPGWPSHTALQPRRNAPVREASLTVQGRMMSHAGAD
ncbi:hypothetical protein IWZ03DRAFT_154581 [Phyllosticta citriasiana]|uniref:Uncharacterized protein n=1 Tax=Phyllosticta citriasiana TaxID=595635 RepID=A0ABR1KP51_9PEZI